MRAVWKLAWSYAIHYPGRMALSALAVVASACVVVWVVSAYDALVSQLGVQAVEYLGRYDLFVVPEDPNDPSVDPGLADSLRQDPRVAEVTPVIQYPIRVINPRGAMGEFGGGGGPWGREGPPGLGGPGEGKRKVPGKWAGPPGTVPAKGPGPTGPGRPRLPFPGGPPGQLTLVGTDADQPPYPLAEGRWIDPKQPQRRDAVVGHNTAEQIGLTLGEDALVIVGTKEYRVRIVGLIEEGRPQPGMIGRMGGPASSAPRTGLAAGPASSALYVPMAVAQHFARGQAKVNLINIQLKPEARTQVAEFLKTWEKRIAQVRPAASIFGVEEIKRSIEEGMMATRTRQEAWAATGLSLLAALFIIFTTLSMGVTERIRQLGLLRAVGLTRTQVGALVVLEALLLAWIGWGGGLLAGWGLLALVSRAQSGLFAQGVSLGPWCIALTGLSAFGGALGASVVPAWRAMHVAPLEAMAPRPAMQPNSPWPAVLAVAGLALIAVNPTLVYMASASMSSDRLYAIYMAVGCTTMAIGFLLLAPAAVRIVEAWIGPLLGRLLGLDPRWLRLQLASNLGRTVGTVAALTVGLGLFVAIQIWGFSMLEPFRPGDWVPDMLVAFQRGGLPDSEIAAVRNVPGVRADRCLPLAVEQPKLAADLTGSQEHPSVIRQDNVILIGLDPEVALGGPDPLLKLRFVAGTPDEAIAKLKQGRFCIVPDHFLRATRLGLGDRFAMVVPNAPSKRVEYTIAGAVALPGWHWMTKFSGLRRREGRSAAMVFADYDQVRRDFELNQIQFFWMNVDRQFGAEHLEEVAQAEKKKQAAAAADPATPFARLMVQPPLDAKRAAVLKIGEALQPIADRNMGPLQPVNMQGLWPIGATMFGPSVRVTTPEQIHAMLLARASQMIWASCYLPLVTLAVTSLGVVNTVIASVRARRWDYGIFRSHGVTRWGLFRIVLAEGLLIGLVACVLSVGFGVVSGWCGTGISQYVSFFGGLAPPLVIPWAQLAIGLAAALGLCLVAALGPAIWVACTEPLELLRAGRAAL